MSMKPKHPIYIVSKGRWGKTLTADALDRMGAEYRVVVEEQEFDNYASSVDPFRLLVLPQSYLDAYVTCDDFGDSKSRGPGAAGVPLRGRRRARRSVPGRAGR